VATETPLLYKNHPDGAYDDANGRVRMFNRFFFQRLMDRAECTMAMDANG
jgi:DUF438 domain-containing protein